MPWEVKKKGEQYCLYKKGTGELVKGSCHTNRADTVKQMRALYASESKSFSEKCSYAPIKEFSDLSEVTDRKHWIQIFPFGHWPHPVYTDTTVNKDSAEQFVKNFHDNVRRQKIKTDYDHGEDKAKGNKASGEYLDMEVREDGVYALVEFTETAFSEIKNGEWSYFSPLFVDVWDDVETNETFENVVIGGGLTNRPWMKDMVPINFSEAVLEEQTTKFRFKDSRWIASDNNGESWRNATTDEVADLEHSEPGTGSPPEPRPQEDDISGDKDGQGIRRDTPPPQDKKEGSQLNAETLKLLGLAEDAKDDEIEAAITSAFAELPQLKEFHEKNKKEKAFAELFPEEHKRMTELAEAEVERESKAFSERYERIVKVEGEGDSKVTTKTNKGPSALVLAEISKAHKAFSEGTGSTADLQNLLDVVMTDKAFVDYGEIGSSRINAAEGEVPTEVHSMRKAFAEKVLLIQTEEGGPDKCSWGDALSKAVTNFPELAKAYNESGTSPA